MNLFEAAVKLTMDSSEYEKGLANAKNGLSSLGGALKTGLATASKVGAAAIAAVGTAAAAGGAALLNAAGNAAAYGDNIDKMSQKLGMSAEAYQEWDAIMQHSGTSIESMQRGMVTLSKAAETDSDAFEALGLSMSDVAGMSQEELFSAVITGLQGMEEGTERTVLAQKLLGGAAKELGPLLNTTAEDTEEMRKRVHELGGVMSNEAVKAAAAYQDSLQDMQTAFSGLSRNLASNFLPEITAVMNGLTEIFSGNGETGIAAISDGISSISKKITEEIPRVLEVGVEIVNALITAITENLPMLLDAGGKAVLQIADGLIKNLPQIISAGLQVILSLAQGIIENLPELIPTIIDVVMQIVETLTEPETLEKLIVAALAIIGAITIGILKALPVLLAGLGKVLENILTAIGNWMYALYEKGREIVNNLAKGVADAARDAVKWGRDLIDNFVRGIRERIQRVIDAVKDVAQNVRNYLGFSEPKLGPLSNFHTYAPDMMQLFAQGIKDNEGLVTDQINKSFDFGVRTMDFGANATGGAGYNAPYGGGFGGTGGGEQTINVDVTLRLDDGTVLQKFAHRLRPYLNTEAALAGGVLS